MSDPNAPRSTLDRWVPAVLLIAGSLFFLGGGSRHPHVGPDPLGAELGSEGFWRHFAQMILDRPSWSTFHTLILAGPVLWAIAAGGVVQAFPRRIRALAEVGRGTLLIGATLWVLEFILDGHLGVRYATMIRLAGDGDATLPLALFGANAFLMARLGMVSLVAFGVTAATFGLSALTFADGHRWFRALGGLGIPLGAWPITAALTGEFWPGPFTTPYWTPLAISFGVWFLLFGAGIAQRDASGPA